MLRPSSDLARIVSVVLWMGGTLLSFSALAVSIRSLSGRFSVFEILATRSALGLIILIGFGLAQPSLRHTLSLRRVWLHIARNGVHFFGQYLWALGITLLPLATVFSLEFTTPAFTVTLATLLLGERLTPSRLGVVVLGLAGILVIVRPGLDTFQPSALIVVVSAIAFAVAFILLKRLTATETSYAVVFYMNLIQLPLAFAGSDPFYLLRFSTHDFPVLTALGISGLSGHYCLARALAVGDASLVVPLDFLRLPLIAVVGWLLFGERVDWVVFLGSGLIIAGIMWNLHAEASAARAAGAPRQSKNT